MKIDTNDILNSILESLSRIDYIRPEEILRLTKLDPHSLGKWRVNGALPQIGAWYDAFGITEENPMFLPVDKRVSIW